MNSEFIFHISQHPNCEHTFNIQSIKSQQNASENENNQQITHIPQAKTHHNYIKAKAKS